MWNRCVMPPRPTRELLVRPRLLSQLRARFECRLVTLVAGPGMGKTTLLAQAVDENRLAPHGVDVWLTCEVSDGDARHLTGGLLEALGERLAPGAVASAAEVMAAIWRRSPVDVCVILDDAHLIPAGSAGAHLLGTVLQRGPTNLHLVLSGRRPLPLPAPRLELDSGVRLREYDLAFDMEEQKRFAELRGVPVLATAGAWPALAELTASAGKSYAIDYLVAELLLSMSVSERRLLAAVSAVGGADNGVAAALAGHSVDLADLFTRVPLTVCTDGWWTLHSLWRPALAKELTAAETAAFQRKVAAVIRAEGKLEHALTLLIAAGAWRDVVDVTAQICAVTHPQVGDHFFETTYIALPPAEQRGPAGLLLRAMIAKEGQVTLAVELLQQAAELFRKQGHTAGESAALSQVGHISWWRADTERLIAVIVRATQLNGVGSTYLPTLVGLGQAVLADAQDEPARSLKVLDRLAPVGGDLDAVVAYLRAWALVLLGDPEQAAVPARRARDRATGAFRSSGLFIHLLANWLLGRRSCVAEELPRLAEATPESGRSQNIVIERAVCSVACSYLGEPQRAAEYLTQAEAALATSESAASGQTTVALARAARLVVMGNEPAARRVLESELDRNPLTHPSVRRLHRLALPLSYVLVPVTRPAWDRMALPQRFAEARTLAQAIVALRDSNSVSQLAAVEPPEPRIIAALLPPPWAVELALALSATDRPVGAELLDVYGAVTRGLVKPLITHRCAAVARQARLTLPAIPTCPTQRLRLIVLGPLEILRDGRLVTDPLVRRERVRQLLLYLMVNPVTSREQVAAELWPEQSDGTARHNLRVNLAHLQRLLEPSRPADDPPYFLRVDGERLRLIRDNSLELDVDEFDGLLTDADRLYDAGAFSLALSGYWRAVRLCRGEYLVDVRYDDWASLERERVQVRIVRAAVRAGELLLGAGSPQDAERLAEHVIGLDAQSERAYRLLAAAALAQGDRDAARRALCRCRDEVGDVALEPATQMLARRVNRAAPPVG